MKIEVAHRLAELFDVAGGGLSVEDIVAEARHQDSPLHDEFEWDLGLAHEIYLKDRARSLLRQWYVEHQGKKDHIIRARNTVSLAVSVDGAPPNKQKRLYYRLDDVLASAELTQQMLMNARADAQAFRRKYAVLSELVDVISAIDRFESTFEEPSTRPDTGAADDRPTV